MSGSKRGELKGTHLFPQSEEPGCLTTMEARARLSHLFWPGCKDTCYSGTSQFGDFQWLRKRISISAGVAGEYDSEAAGNHPASTRGKFA